MIRRRLMRVAIWSLAALVLLAAAGFLWLRQSPYWAGITLFAESHRVENFRDMGRVFPARAVPRGETVWAEHEKILQSLLEGRTSVEDEVENHIIGAQKALVDALAARE